MSKLNSFILFLLVVIFSWQTECYSQPRVNSAINYTVVATGALTSSPIGWYYDSSHGKWIGYIGVINSEYHTNPSSPRKMTSSDWAGFGDDGIFSLQVKKVKVSDRYFYLIYQTYWTGEYDYPAIMRGWRFWKETKVYVLEESEYQKLLNLQVGINKIRIIDYVIPYMDGLNKGQTAINENLSTTFRDILCATEDNPYKSPWKDYIFYFKLEEDGKTVRFHLPTDKMLRAEALEINRQNEIKREINPYQYYRDVPTYDCINFDESYYEMSAFQFSKLKIK